MKINIGSTNEVKISAVKETLTLYKDFAQASFQGIKTQSGISDQPKSMEETITGAKNRAQNAFRNCDYSFGIESGLMAVPHTKTGYMDFTVCAIYDGKNFHLGFSPALECPRKVIDLVFGENLNLNDAFYKAGLTSNPAIGNDDGMVSLLTKGRMTRKDYTKPAIIMAMIHLDK